VENPQETLPPGGDSSETICKAFYPLAPAGRPAFLILLFISIIFSYSILLNLIGPKIQSIKRREKGRFTPSSPQTPPEIYFGGAREG